MHESEKWKGSCSVMSDSSWPHGLQPTRFLHPWDFPGKSTRVGCHCLLQQSCEMHNFCPLKFREYRKIPDKCSLMSKYINILSLILATSCLRVCVCVCVCVRERERKREREREMFIISEELRDRSQNISYLVVQFKMSWNCHPYHLWGMKRFVGSEVTDLHLKRRNVQWEKMLLQPWSLQKCKQIDILQLIYLSSTG